MHVFRGRLSVSVCTAFPFGFEGGCGNLIVSITAHCISIYFGFALTLVAKRMFIIIIIIKLNSYLHVLDLQRIYR